MKLYKVKTAIFDGKKRYEAGESIELSEKDAHQLKDSLDYSSEFSAPTDKIEVDKIIAENKALTAKNEELTAKIKAAKPKEKASK